MNSLEMTTHVFLVVRSDALCVLLPKSQEYVASFLTPTRAGCSPAGGLGSEEDPRSRSPAGIPAWSDAANTLGAISAMTSLNHSRRQVLAITGHFPAGEYEIS